MPEGPGGPVHPAGTVDPAERADEVWHRALLPQPVSDLPGDVALHHALSFHGTVMRGGLLKAVEDAIEAGDGEHLDAVASAYLWLGVGEVADLVGRVRSAVEAGGTRRLAEAETLERESQQEIDAVMPDDAALEAVLLAKVVESPGAFSPGGVPRFSWADHVRDQAGES
ncbi:hypothetical protein [Nocardioides nanhaiensis]|uniref:Uncharacterized protein n=1 Tax=Nocardioides nanhaiensis TaxID=1476871 RepID=A0ABP8X1X8_9ACTN